MPQTKQRLPRNVIQRRPQHSRTSDPGVCLTAEEIEKFLDACQEKGLSVSTVEWYRHGLKHLSLLVEQAMDRLLEQEQLEIGWDAQ